MTTRSHLRARADDGIPVLIGDGGRYGVLVAFTGRVGGVSRPPYDTLNLAARVGDDPGAVEANRARVAVSLGFDADRLVLARQVHGAGAVHVSDGDSGVVGEADVLVARAPGPVLAVLTADCAPVALVGDGGVALVHAGWRGLVAGAIEAGSEAVGPVHAAWIGPCIHACCYRVGSEVTAAFRARGLPVAAADRVDPARAATVILRRSGVGDIVASTVCTSCDRRYFSYRRDRVTGRQGAFIALTGSA